MVKFIFTINLSIKHYLYMYRVRANQGRLYIDQNSSEGKCISYRFHRFMPKTDISIIKGCIYAILTNCWKSKLFAKSSQTLQPTDSSPNQNVHTNRLTHMSSYLRPGSVLCFLLFFFWVFQGNSRSISIEYILRRIQRLKPM